MKELCPDCAILGKCLFEGYATLVAAELNLKKITDQEVLQSAAFEVHQKIAAERIALVKNRNYYFISIRSGLCSK